jgi:hypothetical protein
VPDDQIQRAYRVRVTLFFVLVVIMIAVLFLIYQLSHTFYQLNLAESERDRWQRPDDVIESLNLKDGSVVADVGSGVGYFSLKLAPKVAEHGSVLAEDILGESLTFLWIRAFPTPSPSRNVWAGRCLGTRSLAAILITIFRFRWTSQLPR